MASRVFDRRGRQNWSEEKRLAEDKRVRERRVKSDRRVAERRKGLPWPDERSGNDERCEERRKMNRRAAEDSVQKQVTTTLLTPDSPLQDGITELAKQQNGFVLVKNAENAMVGTLSEHNVIRAIAEGGQDALSHPVSKYLTKLD